jgi:hypothetical protein
MLFSPFQFSLNQRVSFLNFLYFRSDNGNGVKKKKDGSFYLFV